MLQLLLYPMRHVPYPHFTDEEVDTRGDGPVSSTGWQSQDMNPGPTPKPILLPLCIGQGSPKAQAQQEMHYTQGDLL